MTTTATIVIIFIFSVLLVKATDISVASIKNLSKKSKLGQFALSTIFMGIVTSLPEIFVAVSSALSNAPTLAMGNVWGSNIANLSIVIGGAAILGGTIRVSGEILRRDALYAFLAGVTPLLLLWDKQLSRLDGLILISLYLFYIFQIIKEEQELADDGEKTISFLLRQISPKTNGKDYAKIFGSVALLLFSADVIVRLAKSTAASAGFSLFFTGMFVVALGTSLPELAFGLKAIRKKKTQMVWGNLLGSVVANGTLILGLTSLIRPINLNDVPRYAFASGTYLVVFALFYALIHSKRRLERWEGFLLAIVYLIFAILEVGVPQP
jgi:cation:H+ antiporter